METRTTVEEMILTSFIKMKNFYDEPVSCLRRLYYRLYYFFIAPYF